MIRLVAMSVLLASCSVSRTPAEPQGPFSERIVVFVEASPDEIADALERYSDEDSGVVADDLMFYRATAHEYLEQRQLPVLNLSGRASLSFVVNGEVEHFSLVDVPTLDVIVLYEHDRAPQIISPIEIEAVDAYFAEP